MQITERQMQDLTRAVDLLTTGTASGIGEALWVLRKLCEALRYEHAHDIALRTLVRSPARNDALAQTLAKALGFAMKADLPDMYPDATEADGVEMHGATLESLVHAAAKVLSDESAPAIGYPAEVRTRAGIVMWVNGRRLRWVTEHDPLQMNAGRHLMETTAIRLLDMMFRDPTHVPE